MAQLNHNSYGTRNRINHGISSNFNQIHSTNQNYDFPTNTLLHHPKLSSFFAPFTISSQENREKAIITIAPLHISSFKSFYLQISFLISFLFSPMQNHWHLMTKKMKMAAFYSYDEARARFKHQTLLQDYIDLQQETETERNNLMALKQKKLTLQAEVRFLRQRRKFLLKNNSSTRQEQVLMNPQMTRLKKSNKEKVHTEKQKILHKLPPAEKNKPPQSILPTEFDLILENSLRGLSQQSVQRAVAKQRVRINGPKAYPFLDLGHKGDIFVGQEHSDQTRKPVIDLNQMFREDELEEEGLIKNGKKVSWQHPVAVVRV